MNYLKNVVAFESFAELHQISDKSYRLWHALMSINNTCAWIDWFEVPLIRLQSKLALTNPQTIYNARNQLVQLGLLEFKKGSRGQSATYHLIPLVKDNDKDTSTNSLNTDLTNTLNNTLTNDLNNDLTSPLTLNKQNKTKQNKNNTSERSQATPHEQKKKFSADSVEYRLAMYLFGKIKQNNPQHKDLTESQEQKWADHIRLMIQRDNRTPQQIKNMIDWSQADTFWRQNILSTAKLRKQYDTMAPKANSEWQTQQPKKRVYE
ncbi:hypothetical protein K3F51_05050 [Limosilactobacillus reuteri]|uniref:hypothetical protein n=1 Tax=Limosilactobacillus reuteri TaxID=1598 RepID=UPI0010465E54|nr:hypothetical protein [Limosilactobacillus reuteri]UAW61282.1 hypothetical protein K3F51_05050 [Limosilactobacillus reuteri]